MRAVFDPILRVTILFDSSTMSAFHMNENIMKKRVGILECELCLHPRMRTIFSFMWVADVELESNKITTRKVGCKLTHSSLFKVLIIQEDIGTFINVKINRL
jgi:hypothetical protein